MTKPFKWSCRKYGFILQAQEENGKPVETVPLRDTASKPSFSVFFFFIKRCRVYYICMYSVPRATSHQDRIISFPPSPHAAICTVHT